MRFQPFKGFKSAIERTMKKVKESQPTERAHQCGPIHTPGHTPGSVTFYSPEEQAAFVGDLLYQHGPGLTNFPGGNRYELEQSIINKILTLPSSTLLLSGHSSPITVAQESRLLLQE